jgi:hypothetical protein
MNFKFTCLIVCLFAWTSRYIKKNLKLPNDFENHATYSPDEVQAFLWDSESLIGPDWILVYINVSR